MHPACRLRLRVECPGFREVETEYHVELGGPDWARSAYLMLGMATSAALLLNTSLDDRRTRVLAAAWPIYDRRFRRWTRPRDRSTVEIQPGHRVRSLGIVEVPPSASFQQGFFRGFWRSSPGWRRRSLGR